MSVFTNTAGANPEHVSVYVAALLELLGDRDPREVLGETAAQLRARTASLPHEVVSRPEAPGKWSAVAVIQHLADAELIWGWRSRLVLAHDKPVVTPYDQDLWADRLHYKSAKLTESLEQFTVLRQINLRLIDRLSNDELQRTGLHPERGEESIGRMIRLAAAHDLMHLRQIDRILGAESMPRG